MYYPFIKLDHFDAFTTIHNFSPNNWQNVFLSDKYIYIIWSDGLFWNTHFVVKLKKNDSIELSSKDFPDYIFLNQIAFIYPSSIPLDKKMLVLPSLNTFNTTIPNWRATIGIVGEKTRVSYQGEIEPFPIKSSMLTFHPFLQYEDFSNFLLIVNLIKTPELIESNLEIYNATSGNYIATEKVKSNSATLISLNKYNFNNFELPVFINRKMAGIPFGFGYNKNHSILSLEHTHPPASFVLHGNRHKLQSQIKEKWFSVLNDV